jgi:hypothetical protein
MERYLVELDGDQIELFGRYTMADLQEDRSLVRNLLNLGIDLYVVDWGNPGSLGLTQMVFSLVMSSALTRSRSCAMPYAAVMRTRPQNCSGNMLSGEPKLVTPNKRPNARSAQWRRSVWVVDLGTALLLFMVMRVAVR